MVDEAQAQGSARVRGIVAPVRRSARTSKVSHAWSAFEYEWRLLAARDGVPDPMLGGGRLLNDPFIHMRRVPVACLASAMGGPKRPDAFGNVALGTAGAGIEREEPRRIAEPLRAEFLAELCRGPTSARRYQSCRSPAGVNFHSARGRSGASELCPAAGATLAASRLNSERSRPRSAASGCGRAVLPAKVVVCRPQSATSTASKKPRHIECNPSKGQTPDHCRSGRGDCSAAGHAASAPTSPTSPMTAPESRANTESANGNHQCGGAVGRLAVLAQRIEAAMAVPADEGGGFASDDAAPSSDPSSPNPCALAGAKEQGARSQPVQQRLVGRWPLPQPARHQHIV
mmetsp:Transcript_141464/g.452186  ORF Transcript_141464/g.452186 Transcript_141464/m.452186 type:complete len:344 (-) Transcript_141464:315-1346(-)